MRILLVEDEAALRTALRDTLAAQGYAVDSCADGTGALDALMTNAYDLALLDRMLPELDGLAVLRAARKAGLTTPVLMLTALDAIGDRVEGLDAGADDYLPKPFATQELLARVRALARRPPELQTEPEILCGDIALAETQRQLRGPDGSCELSTRECALLALLLRNAGQTLPRDTLLLRVWGPDTEVESGNLDNYIHLVRRRLAMVGSRLRLRTVRGLGYVLEDVKC